MIKKLTSSMLQGVSGKQGRQLLNRRNVEECAARPAGRGTAPRVGDTVRVDCPPADRESEPDRLCGLNAAQSLRTQDRGNEPLTPRVLVQRLFDAGLGGRSLGLGIVDRRFGQLRDPFSGCDCVEARRTAGGQFAAALLAFDLRRRAIGRPSRSRARPSGVVAERPRDGADRLGELHLG